MPKRSNRARGRNSGRCRLSPMLSKYVSAVPAPSCTREVEHVVKDGIEPERRGRAAEQVVVLREQSPRRAPVERGRAASVGDTQVRQRHALAVQHAVEVVIGRQQQLGGVLEWGITGEPGRIGVTVRTDDRQARRRRVNRTRDGARAGVGRQQAIGMQFEGANHGATGRDTSACLGRRERNHTVSRNLGNRCHGAGRGYRRRVSADGGLAGIAHHQVRHDQRLRPGAQAPGRG